jgi:UDP-glucose 4-epimerase
MAKKWLITGGCGFIGTALIRNLTRAGDQQITVVDNLSIGSREDLEAASEFREMDPGALPVQSWSRGQSCQLVVGDIGNRALAEQVCAGADVVVHLAANAGVAQSVQDPHFDCLTNVVGTLNYLDAARRAGVPRFIFASSGAAVGECEPPTDEQKLPRPASPYGASKAAGEAYCSTYHRTFGLETVCLRFGNVYGPGSKHKGSVVAKFIKQILAGETLEVYGDGGQSRDYLYIDDLVQAIRAAAEAENVGGETFQIATSRETTVLELLEKLHTVSKARGVEPARVSHAATRSGDVRRNFSDTSKAARMLGWSAPTTLDEGLGRTFDWFMSVSGTRPAA